MRNISFALTTPQFIDGSKDVTRRLGWEFLKPGDRLMACEKCQGIKKGGLNRLGVIEVVHVSRQPLRYMIDSPKWGKEEARREGFPHFDGIDFADFFCKEMKVTPDTIVTRIEFKKVTNDQPS